MSDSSSWRQIIDTLEQVEAGQAPASTLRPLVNGLPDDLVLADVRPRMLGTRLVNALYPSRETAAALREALLLDAAPVIRFGALYALAQQLPPDQMGQLLLDVLEYEHPLVVRIGIWDVFYRAKETLAVADLPRLARHLRDALHDEDPGVRGRAAYLAGQYHVESLCSAICKIAGHDPDLLVRADAIRGLQHCGAANQTPAVIEGVFEQIAKAERLAAAGEATLRCWADAGNVEAARWLACRAVMPK